jgi:hypothetical protein
MRTPVVSSVDVDADGVLGHRLHRGPFGRRQSIRSNAFVRTLKGNAPVELMGRVGECGDRAPAGVVLHPGQRWATREELRLAIITWIGLTHHRRRRTVHPGE